MVTVVAISTGSWKKNVSKWFLELHEKPSRELVWDKIYCEAISTARSSSVGNNYGYKFFIVNSVYICVSDFRNTLKYSTA